MLFFTIKHAPVCPNFAINNFYMDINNFIKQNANVSVSISAIDLKEAFCQWTKEVAHIDEQSEILTIKEACQRLGVTRQTLLRWNKLGYLKPIKIGGKPRYQKKDIDKLLGL